MTSPGGRELFMAAVAGERTARPPVWLMRQAGRHLPEYRKVRADHSFREAISTPAVAERISLQPWDRYRPDGVVMYSDILTALEPLGVEYAIESGTGPVIPDPPDPASGIDLAADPIGEHLGYVGELLTRLDERLDGAAALIGFVGGPFTLAAYLIEGRPSRTFMELRRVRYAHPEVFARLLETIGDVLVAYARYQVDHGADVIQLFDTYAGLLGAADYRTFLLPVHQRVLDAVDVPTIVYARNMAGRLDLLAESGADVVGLDWSNDIAAMRDELGDVPVQGNLDPAALLGSPEDVRDRVHDVVDAAGGSGHVLNLGHGVDKRTPPEHVTAFVEAAKSIDR